MRLFCLAFLIFSIAFSGISASLFLAEKVEAKKVSGRALDRQARRECNNDTQGKKTLEKCIAAYRDIYNGGQSTAVTCSTPVITPGNAATGSVGGVSMGPADPSCLAGVRLGEKAAARDGGKDETRARKVCKTNENPGASDRQVAACRAGFQGAKDGKTKAQTCRSYTDDDTKESCEAGFDAQKNGSSQPALQAYTAYDEDSAEDEELGCQGGVLGWILCPVINTLADVVRETAGVVDSLMQYRLLATSSSDRNIDGTQEGVREDVNPSEILRAAWQNFLNVANLLLVIAFLAIIFSQATSTGISNYGIKRMLPRVIAGAILMNLSFYVCAFLIDISNIAGNSILGMFQGMANISGDPSIKSSMEQLSGPNGLAQSIAGGVLVVAAAVAIVAFFLVPILLGILLVFIILAGRQVVLTVLILLSPLAFVAWLLPNTEQYFKKWWSLFTQMLFAYPAVMAVFGASLFVASLIQSVNAIDSGSIGGALDVVLPLVILVIPLFLLPKIIMSTNSILGKIGGAANGFINKAGGDWAKKAYSEGRQNLSKRAGMKMANNDLATSGKNRFTRGIGRTGRYIGGSGARRRFSKQNREEDMKRAEEDYLAQHALDKGDSIPAHVAARAAATQAKRSKEEVDNQEALLGAKLKQKAFSGKDTGKERATMLAAELRTAAATGDSAKAKAAQNLLMQQGSDGVNALRDLSKEDLGEAMHQTLASNLNSNHREKIEEKDPELLNYLNTNGAEGAKSEGAYKDVTPEGIAKLTDKAFGRAVASGQIDKQIIEAATNPAVLSKLGTDRSAAVTARAHELMPNEGGH